MFEKRIFAQFYKLKVLIEDYFQCKVFLQIDPFETSYLHISMVT